MIYDIGLVFVLLLIAAVVVKVVSDIRRPDPKGDPTPEEYRDV